MLKQLKQKYPVIIVGGGVNGVGIARDCALRGIDCLLVEKGDFSGGTSGSSSGMIHGGPRYMLGDVDVTRLACLDSGYIQKIAPHLLFRIPFLYTVHHSKHRSEFQSKILLESVEAFFEAYDRFVPLKNGKPHTRLTPQEVLELEPNIPAKNLVGGVTFDEWGIDVPRLCIANAVDAKEHGADVLNHTRVVRVLRTESSVTGVEIENLLNGERRIIDCQILVNATGPWSGEFGKLMGVDIKIRGGKGIHLSFDRRLFNMAVVSQCIDGREIFVMPYENESILGTTDDDYFGDLDNQKCTQDEIEYIMDGIEQVFPAIRDARMIRGWSGVRPTIYERGVNENDLSREHEMLDHETRDGLAGAISMTGGKLASYRIMSKELVDLICQKLKITAESTTHNKFLPGGDVIPDVVETAREYKLDSYLVSRLIYRHGSRALRILDSIRQHPEWGTLLCGCEPVTEAEVRYVVEHEMAFTLSDVRRRTRLSMGPCQGMNCVLPASSILSTLRPDIANDPLQITKDFSQAWWWNRACVMNADQLKQEELNQSLMFATNGLDVE